MKTEISNSKGESASSRDRTAEITVRSEKLLASVLDGLGTRRNLFKYAHTCCHTPTRYWHKLRENADEQFISEFLWLEGIFSGNEGNFSGVEREIFLG
ncbi:unnamed protein product [Camellia sinensis]